MKAKRVVSKLATLALALNVALAGTAMTAAPAVYAAADDVLQTDLIRDDYEAWSGAGDLEAAGYTLTPNPGTATNEVRVLEAGQIVNGTVNNDRTGKVLQVRDESSSDTKFVRQLPVYASGFVTVEFDWRIDKTGMDSHGYKVLRVENPAGQAFAELRLSDSGANLSQYLYGASSNKKIITGYKQDQWYQVKLEIDMAAKKSQAFARTAGSTGAYTTAGVFDFSETAASSELAVSQLTGFTTGTQTANMYYDNLKVYTKTTLPAAPSGLKAASGSGQVTLSWNAASGTTYTVKRSLTSGGPYTDLAANVEAGTFTDSGLVNGTAYYYVVTAQTGGLSSANSAEVSATPQSASTPPAAPTGLKAIAGDRQAVLSWNAASGATSYTVKHSTNGGAYVPIASEITATSYTATDLTNGTSYSFAVSANNKNGESAPSDAVSVVPAEGASVDVYNMTGFSTTNVGGGTLPETDAKYIKVYNANDFAKAIGKKNGYKVIEIMNDLDLGWNEIPAEAKTTAGSLFSAHNAAKTHPVLLQTGVTKIYIQDLGNMTIFSANGAKIKHASFVVKRVNNLIIRNLEFDELWEWDEESKGDYDKNDWDYITLEASSQVWIDHCTFHKSYDGGIDIKEGSSGVTISWSLFKGDDRSPNGWVGQQINAMEAELTENPGSTKYPMYKFLRNQGLSTQDIIDVSAGQKKQHLVGANELKANNADLQATLHHNYYYDMQDRMPRLRGGNVHTFNIVMDTAGNWAAKKRISPAQETAIASAGYHFGVTSNGAISTEDGAVLVENSHIIDILYPIRNNQKDPAKPQYTGKIAAINTIYSLDGQVFQGDSTTPGSPLAPVPAPVKDFSWSGMTELPYTYTPDDPSTLIARLTAPDGAGSGKLQWSKENWQRTSGYTGGTTTPTAPAAVSGVTATVTNEGQVALTWNAAAGATGYTVKRSTTDGSGYAKLAAVSAPGYTDTSVTAGTTYYYVIAATNAAGEGALSAQVRAKPEASQGGATKPAAPGALQASAGDGRVTLSWGAVADALSYTVKRGASPAGPFTVTAANVSSTSYTDLTVSNGTTYFYVVSASNANGEGSDSVTVMGTPAAATSVVQPGDLVVSPEGLDGGEGTLSSPLSLTAALTRIEPGKTIHMRGGVYAYDVQVTIDRDNSGTPGAMKKLIAYGSELPILDFYAQPYNAKDPSQNARGLQINGSYWLVKGLEVRGSADNGVYVAGHYNRVENLNIHHNKDTGLQLGRYTAGAPREVWPTYNQIINVYSHDNFDPDDGEDADGFAAKLTVGAGNVFDGCIAAYNTDDGWDLYAKSDTGPIDPVVIRNSVAHHNGATSDGLSTSNSDGNGYKLGGEKIPVDHIVENSVAFLNKKHGFTYNSNPGSIRLTNNTSWSNGQSNFAFDAGTHMFTNNLSYMGGASDKKSGTDVENSNVWWISKKSTNGKGLKATDADFITLTPALTRNADGFPNLGDFLKLATNSPLKGAGTPAGTDIGVLPAVSAGGGSGGGGVIETAAALSGPEAVGFGQPFSLEHGLTQVNPANAIYAQELSFQYDAAAVEFVSADAIQAGLSVVRVTTATPGQVRIFAASLGQQAGVKADGTLLKLNWKAKTLGQSQTSAIVLASVKLANAAGQISSAAGSTVSVVLGSPLQTSALQAAISSAQAAHDAAVEGTKTGQYPAGSKAELKAVIDLAIQTLAYTTASQQQLDEAEALVDSALAAFQAKKLAAVPGDLNDDRQVDIGDLAMLAAAYGLKSDHAEWSRYAHMDINQDGILNIVDLSYVASLIP
ncbi:fibronectin type III domain-containing protein [Paenibacillus puerhi]|nr:fibronectin type III domain-containing protein [Paenibacillus puerhi]